MYQFARNVEAAAAIVQVESDPIDECRERLRALRAAAELALADQGDEEPEKQPPDRYCNGAAEGRFIFVCLCVSVFLCFSLWV